MTQKKRAYFRGNRRCFFFLLRFAQLNEFDLGECLEDKIQKNNEKYVMEKVKGKNLKYTEL